MLAAKRVLLGVTGSIEAYQAADLIGVLKNQFANPVATGGDAMDAMTHARLEVPAQFFKILSHTSRLYMIEELLRGEKCVLELTALVGADISIVSKHLAVLRSAGIVTEEKRANRVL
jgi:predicted transcriptional regulator